MPAHPGPRGSARKRSSSFADLPYSRQRNPYVAYAPQEARERERVSRPTFARRSSYITIVTSLPDGTMDHTDLELDFSQAEIERLISMSEPAPLERENQIQWQWAGSLVPGPTSRDEAWFEPPCTENVLEKNRFEEEIKPWRAALDDFTSRYSASSPVPSSSSSANTSNITPIVVEHLESLSSRLDANASTLEFALKRLQSTLSATESFSFAMASRIEDMKDTRTVVVDTSISTSSDNSSWSPVTTCIDSEDNKDDEAMEMEILGRRAGKMPSSEHALANLRSITDEVVTLVREVSENVAKLSSTKHE